MNVKLFIKSLLIIFVVVSCAFLVYKEFYPKSESNVTNAAETQSDKSSVPVETLSDKENLPSTEVIGKQGEVPSSVAEKASTSKVIAYYFHGTFRCTTCRTIEKYSKEAIELYFAKELKNRTLEFRPINVEEPENRHYSQDYQLFSRALVLSLNKDGKEIKWKNLTEVWTHVGDREKFFQYVKDEVAQFLNELG
jgi:hypothetical protein